VRAVFSKFVDLQSLLKKPTHIGIQYMNLCYAQLSVQKHQPTIWLIKGLDTLSAY